MILKILTVLLLSIISISSSGSFAIDIPSSPASLNMASQMLADNMEVNIDASKSVEEDPIHEETISNLKNENEILQLPMAGPNDPSIPTLKFGETLRLEALGPIIINTDGTTRRIENWDQLSEKEREVTWRRISKRNEERRQALMMAAADTSTTEPLVSDTENSNVSIK